MTRGDSIRIYFAGNPNLIQSMHLPAIHEPPHFRLIKGSSRKNNHASGFWHADRHDFMGNVQFELLTVIHHRGIFILN